MSVWRTLRDLCKCGHEYGDHAARDPMKCIYGYSPPWWKNTPDMIKCEAKCQAFEPVDDKKDNQR